VQAAKLVESVIGVGWATDPTGTFVYATPTAPVFRGLTVAELNSSGEDAAGWMRVIHPDDYPAAAVAWRRALESGAPYQIEHRMLGVTGAYDWVRASGQPLRDGGGRITGWYGCVVDCAPSPVPQPTGTGMPDMRTVHPHDRPAVAQATARAFVSATPQISSYRQLQADGSYQWVELRIDSESSVSVDPSTHVAMLDHAWTTAESLGETVEAVRIAKFLENLYGGAWALDARGRFTYATPTSQTSIGLTLEDLNESLDGREFIDGGEHGWKRTVHPDDYEQMSTGFRNGLLRGEPWNVEYRILRAKGDYVWHRVGAYPTHDDYGRVTGWYGVSLDIDVYKKTEAALRESIANEVRAHEELRLAQERLARAGQAASLAELSASIAHEVNQPLAAVVANAHACQRWLATEPPRLDRAQTTVERIIRDANAAADVVSRIRGLFKQAVPTHTATWVAPVIAEAKRLLADLALAQDVDIDIEVDAGMPAIRGDRLQLQQVLVNLMRNGIEAMGGGGRTLRVRAQRDGDFARIEVADEGAGLADPSRIFDAFYTTKTSGMGMGLGISRSIVESHGGRLWVESDPGHGATFTFTLPLEA
jgi:PAS domain S-box-containing protein